MRVFAPIVGLVLGAVVLSTAGSTAHAQETGEQQKQKPVVVTIKIGDSLSKIAKKHDTSYLRIYYANKKIKHPDVIFAGQKVRIPDADEKLKKRALPGAATTQAPVKQQSYHAPAYRPAARISTAGDHVSGGVWDRLAACESGGNWHINTGNGYYGGLQFSLSSWRGVGGSGYPHQASKAEQIKRATMLKASGGWGHWPACSAKLGLR